MLIDILAHFPVSAFLLRLLAAGAKLRLVAAVVQSVKEDKRNPIIKSFSR